MNVQTLPDLVPQSWLQRQIPSRLAAKAAAALLLLLACAIASSSLRRIVFFILAAPILLLLTLLALAASNIAFSFLYTRHQRHHSAKANQTKRVHSARTMPGSASRHMFQYLRPARFTRPVMWSTIEKQRRQEQAAKYRTPIADTMPQFSEAVDTLIELILRDYVAGWMRAITPEVVLQQRLEEILRTVLIRLKSRVMDLDLTQLLVTRLVPKVTEHVNDFRSAEMALRGNTLERSLTETDELDLLVASKFRGGKLHKALSTSISTQTTEEAYLRNVVQTILPTLLPKSEVQSDILQHLLREILVGAILRPVMDLLSDPDYWNQNVDFYIGNAIREQNMVKKLREVLKQHAANLDSEPSTANALDSYGNGDLLEFEEFMKMIKQCNSLLDVKQIRNAILTQIRKKRALIAGRERDDLVNGHKVEDVIVYINKLELARRRAEKQIEALGGPAYPKRRKREHTPESRKTSALIKLDTILTNPSGLSYFMEFQDQRENMNELQFWLLIDTLDIKDHNQNSEAGSTERSASSTPSSTYSKAHSQKILRTPASDSVNSATGSIKGDLMSSRRASIATTVDFTDTLRDDVRMIYETYFAESAPRPVVVDHSLVDVFRAFALSDFPSTRTDSMSVSDTRRQEDLEASNVRKSLVEAQRQVFEQMLQKDYPEFTKSDLYFKFLTSYQNSMADNNGEKKSSRGHNRGSASNQRSSQGPALLSAILSSPERRREGSEGTKRSSGGSFLDIFGLGRDKDKEKERERGQMRRADTSTTSLRPGFLSPSRARSNTASPVSIRTIDSEEQQFGPKQSSGVSSSTRHAAVPLTRTRSLSSISNGETHGDIGSRTKAVFPYSTSTGHDREGSLDLTDQENLSKSAAGDDSPALQDSLLIELQEPEEDEDDGPMGDTQVGLPIPRMSKDKRGKEKVIDAVEAALSSIMGSPDIQQEDLSSSGLRESLASPSVDLMDPAFSTARDGHSGVDALLEWGKSQKTSKRRSKEKHLDTEGVPGTKSKDSSRVDRGSRKQSQLNGPVRIQDSIMGDQKDERDPFRHHKATSDMSDDSNDESTFGNKGKNVAPSISDTLEGLNDTVQGSVHLAAPGDLLLSDRIKRLEQDIETARKYEDIIDSMIQKTELQGREGELRILKKLKSTQRREILIMEYQKSQYKVQEAENMIMPGRSTVSITSSTVGHEGSKEFALYVIEVHQAQDEDGSFASGWVIARRYSEFFTLHQQLKDKYPIVRQYDLPGKRGFLKLQKSFVETRRIGLERYLQCLVQHEEICQSQELRAFLSQENVALPQFSSSTPLIPYSLFDNDDSKDGVKETNSIPPANQFFFEQLFHSANTPLHSPVAARDPPKSQVHFHASAGATDTPGAGKTEGGTATRDNEGFIRHIYQTVSEGIDDMFSGGSPTVLENITKQLGNQMIQFTMDKDEANKNNTSSSAAVMRRRHGSHSDCDNVRLVQSEILDRNSEPLSSFDILSGPRISFSDEKVQRPDLQRIHSARNRRLSSPDPHTQHQRMQLQLQEQQQDQQHLPQQKDQTQQQQQLQHPVRQGVVENEGVTTFTEPLCDLFIELFELKKNNWLRRQAVVIILQQVLGGTIERKLRDTVKSYVEENMLTFYVTKLRETLWPSTSTSALHSGLSGEYQFVTEDLGLSPTLPQSRTGASTDEAASSPSLSSSTNKRVVRTAEQKASTKDQANRKLSAYLPDLLGSMVGHQNARRGARRVFAAFQNRRLNQQLVYTALDEVIAAMWPELALPSSPSSSSASETAGTSSLPMAPPAATSSASGAAPKSSTATTLTSKATASSSMSTHPNSTQNLTDTSDSGERSGRHKLGRSKR